MICDNEQWVASTWQPFFLFVCFYKNKLMIINKCSVCFILTKPHTGIFLPVTFGKLKNITGPASVKEICYTCRLSCELLNVEKWWSCSFLALFQKECCALSRVTRCQTKCVCYSYYITSAFISISVNLTEFNQFLCSNLKNSKSYSFLHMMCHVTLIIWNLSSVSEVLLTDKQDWLHKVY